MRNLINDEGMSSILYVLITICIYTIVAILLIQIIGPQAVSVSMIPVVLIAYLTNKWVAVINSILYIPINIFILSLSGIEGMNIILTTGVTGSVVIIIVVFLRASYSDLQKNIVVKDRELFETRRKIEMEKQEKNMILQQLETVFRETPVGIIIIRDGKIQYGNPEMAEMYNYSDPDELLGMSIEKLQPDRIVEKLRKRGHNREHGKEVINSYTSWGKRRDGSEFPIRIYAATITLPKGLATLGYIVDNTEVIRQEKIIKEKEREIFQLQKLEHVNLIVSGIAHDVNNLLSLIIGYSQMIDRTTEDVIVHQYSENINNAVSKLSVMMDEMLDYVKNMDDTSEITLIDVNSLILEECDLFLQLTNDDIELNFNLLSDPIYLMIDPNHVIQILMNLILNSQDAIEKDKGLIEIALTTLQKEDGSYIQLTISDNGKGISDEDIDDIFTPFYTTKATGTGLGLASVNRLVALYDGSIQVESKLELGTKFTILFPHSES